MEDLTKFGNPSNHWELAPLDAEMIRYTLLSIPNQIETNIRRTAYSPLVYELKDYAVGIVDHEGRLISQAIGGIPLFLANALGIAVKDGISVHGIVNIKKGDVIISNYAGTIGQHLNNVAMFTPIFSEEYTQQLVGFMAVIVHWIDIGGKEIGSCAPTGTTEIFQEGLQFRAVKLWNEGVASRDLYSIIELNTRFPQMLLGDIEAQLAGCLMGRDLVLKVIERYSLIKVRQAISLMWSRSEAAARKAVSDIQDGVYQASTLIDNDGLDFEKPVVIAVTVRISGEEMTVDFAGTADQVAGSINSGRSGGAVTAARIAFKYLAAPEEPINEGSFRPLNVEIPDGKFLSASATAAMAMYSAPLSSVVDTILKAMGHATPDRVPAGHHATHGILTIAGIDPRTGDSYYNAGGSAGGWGATSDCDGSGPYRTMLHGDTYDVPIEVQEALYPLRYECHQIVVDSGGAGKYRGSWGVERKIKMLAQASVQLNFERLLSPPWGLNGGADAMPAKIDILYSSGRAVSLPKGTVSLLKGDRLSLQSAGGGGFGDPRQRDVSKVFEDVTRGYVSDQSAREIYGVVVRDGAVDLLATETLRSSQATQADTEPCLH